MARLSTYLNDNSISGEDLLAGSNFVSFNAYETKNFKIKDLTEYIQGQISISPSNSTLKANGGIVTEIINGSSSLAVNLSATNITGQLANSDLANSSITINGTAVALGGTITIGEVTGVTAGTYLSGGGTGGTVTVNHDATTRTNATSTASPAYGASFTAIDSLTTNTTGHVTAVNTKTITLPASDNTTYTIEAVASTNDSIIRLVGTDSTTDNIKLIAGSNITLATSEANDTITIASQAFGTVFTVATESAMIAATTTGGDIVIRTDVSKTFIHNGGSAGAAADFSELQFSGINTLALTAGDGIDLSRTTVTNTNNDLTVTNSLATASERGGIKIGYTESGKNYPVELDSEKAYVNVPWANTNQLTTFTVRDSGDDDKLVAHNGFIKFVSATGTADTNLSGAGTTSDPFVMTITSPDENTEYTAGGGLDLNGTVFSHTDTSAQASVDNSGRTYIQDITLDTYGHVTGLVSATETVTDTNRLTTWDLLDDDGDSFTIDHDTHVKFTSSKAAYGTNVSGSGTEADPYIVAVTSPNDTVPNTFRTIKVDTNNDGTANETIGATEELKLIGGTNVTLAEDAGKVTVTSSDTTNWNLTIESVSPGENIAAGNTVVFKGGDRIGLSQSNKEITISGNILTLADLNTVTSGMTGDDTLTFGDDGDDTSVVIKGNLQVAGTTTTNNVETVSTSNGIIFEGTVADNHELKLLAGALTADRTVTIPNATFTIPTQDTWNLNTKTVPGYVAAPGDVANKVWKTSSTGVPGWRDDATGDNTFRTVKVDTNGNGTADNTLGATETLTLKKGTNVTLSESSGVITISSANTEYDVVDSDAAGLAPQLPASHGGKFLKADGTYAVPDYTIDTNTNQLTEWTLTDDDDDNATISHGKHVKFVMATGSLATNTSGSGTDGDPYLVTLTSPDTNTQRTDEDIRDVAAAQWVNGTNTTVVVSDANNTIKINAADTTTNYYLDSISKSGNTLTFSVNGTTNQTYTFGSNAFNSTAYLTAEIDTLATVTGRSATTTTDTTFNSNLTVGGASKWLYVVPNAQGSAPTHAHGLALGWNYSSSGGSRESQIIFAPGSDANSTQEADCQLRFSYKAVNGTITTAAKIWSGGNFYVAGTMQATGGTSTQWNTAYGWGNHASAGYLTSNSTQSKYLRSDADDTSSGDLTVVSYKFNGNASNPTDTTATIYDQQNHGPTISGLGVCFRTGSTPSQTGKLNASGTFTVSGDIIAFGTPSDVTLKENIKPIENALDKVEKLQGVTFDWKEKTEDILNIKEDIGFIAQDVQKVLPELVRENDNGKLSLRHQGVIPVLLEAIKELSDKIKVLENGSTN